MKVYEYMLNEDGNIPKWINYGGLFNNSTHYYIGFSKNDQKYFMPKIVANGGRLVIHTTAIALEDYVIAKKLNLKYLLENLDGTAMTDAEIRTHVQGIVTEAEGKLGEVID